MKKKKVNPKKEKCGTHKKSELHRHLEKLVQEAKAKGARAIMVCVIGDNGLPIIMTELVRVPVADAFCGLGALELIKKSVVDIIAKAKAE